MTAILSFTNWTARFTDAEYALLRHRMRGVQFIGGNILRRWDTAIALDYIDLDDSIMPLFKQALIDEGILMSHRADAVFSSDGASTNTNVFLAAQGTFSGGTLTATGYISARRVR